MVRKFVLASFLAFASSAAAAPPTPVDFERDVAPLLATHCVRCHGPTEKKGKFSLATAPEFFHVGKKKPLVVPGDPDASPLMKLITPRSANERPEMPEEGTPLSSAELAVVRQWILDGAKWPAGAIVQPKAKADKTWWSLQPLKAVEPSKTDDLPEAWAHSPIDRFIFAKLKETGLAPSPPAELLDFIRRVTFDLTGLPPTPEEVNAFIAAAKQNGYDRAAAELVDRLLASSAYGERWGRHWLDVVRFGESTGFERNIIKDDAWPFRDYVIRSFNADKPFDQFISEHVAGDQIAPSDVDVEVGTGFLVAGPYDNVGNQDAKAAAQIRADTLDDTISATGSAFLGLTINCARCHDHKFDPIAQADYYRLQSAFAGVQQGSRELATAEQRARVAAKQAPVAKELAAVNLELESFKGKADPALSPAERDRRKTLSAQKRTLEDRMKALPKVAKAWIGTFKQPAAGTYLMQGGDPQKRGKDIAPASLAVLDQTSRDYELAMNAPEGQRRMALAKWIVADDNPLTPRVLANRVWHYHFGTGIVDTPSDLGYMGGRPTHPELLDWLALELKRNGWKLKPLHRQIVLSQTYRQSAAFRADAASLDQYARLLWRFPPRRLSAEEIRDSTLAIAGVLDRKPGGAGFRLYKYVNDNVSTYVPLDRPGPETYRRAVYHQNARASNVDLLSDFDQPDCALPAPRRAGTVTPLQALTLLNHQFTLDMAEKFAQRLRIETGSEAASQIRRAFNLAFNRDPSKDEQSAATQLIAEHGLPAFCRAILNTNEMIHVR